MNRLAILICFSLLALTARAEIPDSRDSGPPTSATPWASSADQCLSGPPDCVGQTWGYPCAAPALDGQTVPGQCVADTREGMGKQSCQCEETE